MDQSFTEMDSKPEISHLQRREIQAPLAACLIREYAHVLGEDQALEIAARAIQEDSFSAGQKMAKQSVKNDLAELARVVREVWAKDGALTLNFVAENEKELTFEVQHCCYVDLYEKMGMRDLGFCLSCCRDEAFAHGFNPEISLSRSQTLMQGGDCCNFHFTLRTT
mgnify:FL=1